MGKARLPDGVRVAAQEMFDHGLGYRSVAGQLALSTTTARRWNDRWRQGLLLGSEAMAQKSYPFEVKVAAVERFLAGMSTSDVVLEYEISTRSLLDKWVAIYRAQGAQGLQPKLRGRIPKDRSAETLEQKVKRLEMENTALKKLQALVTADQRRTGKKPKSSGH
jgi:transposase-like protein